MNVLSRLYRYLRRYKAWALVAFGSMIIFALTQTMLMALIPAPVRRGADAARRQAGGRPET